MLATYQHEVQRLVDAADSLLQRAGADRRAAQLGRAPGALRGNQARARRRTAQGHHPRKRPVLHRHLRRDRRSTRPPPTGEHLRRHPAPRPRRPRRDPRPRRTLAARPDKRLESPSTAHLRHRPQRPTAIHLGRVARYLPETTALLGVSVGGSGRYREASGGNPEPAIGFGQVATISEPRTGTRSRFAMSSIADTSHPGARESP